MVRLHDYEIKEGDRVWSCNFGYGEVKTVANSNDSPYHILVRFTEVKGRYESYTEDGKRNVSDPYPTLFWRKQEFNLNK